MSEQSTEFSAPVVARGQLDFKVKYIKIFVACREYVSDRMSEMDWLRIMNGEVEIATETPEHHRDVHAGHLI